MSQFAVVLRQLAADDIDAAVAYYRTEAGPVTAARFVEALGMLFERLSDHPGTGTLRYAEKVGIGGMRFAQLRGFPWLLFYVVSEDVEVIRLLHSHSDIPAWLTGEA